MLTPTSATAACATPFTAWGDKLTVRVVQLAWCCIVVWSCWSGAAARAEDSRLQLRLKGGGWATGTLLPGERPGYLRLQCPAFDEPLEFAFEALSSLETQGAELGQSGARQSFYLTNGATLAGTLGELDDAIVVIESACLGKVRLPRAVLQHFKDNRDSDKLIYAGPRGPAEWSGTANGTDWKYEAGAVCTSKSGATAVGDVNLPEQSAIRIVLAWSKEPNFTLSLGCIRPGAIERIAAAASLEVWDGQLVMVRETDKEADVVVLPDLLTERNRLELRIYLDQAKGTVAVCTPSGRVLGQLHIEEGAQKHKGLVALSNHAAEVPDGELRLERCEVRQWNGELPQEFPESGDAVLLDDGRIATGKLGSLDGDHKALSFVNEDGETSQIPLKSIREALLSNAAQEDESPTAIRVELADGSFLVGEWTTVDADKVSFKLAGVDEPLTFLVSNLVGVSGNSEAFHETEVTGRLGELQTETAVLRGCLTGAEGDGVLRWRARGTAAPATLATASNGKIEYGRSRPEPPPRNSASTRLNILRIDRGAVILNGRVSSPEPAPVPRKTLQIGLKLRRGDELPGIVQRIDERGVTFESAETSVTFLPNDQLEAVFLTASRSADTQSPEKLKRLLTVPRSAKDDPPTHLLVATNGDYLRGRLIELDRTRALMQVRLEEVELPIDRIAEVHWLHRRDWKEDESDKGSKQADAQEPSHDGKLQVLVIRVNDRPVTFVPSSFANRTLFGNNDLFGECKVEIANVKTLHFGVHLSDSLQKTSQEQWKLSLATLPKVYQESERGSSEDHSPLVGKPAPEFTLDTASGAKFVLSQQRGRVLVLDFWASWCGPCMQTMPEVERVVNEVGGDQVSLVAVNLQETRERALATIKRLGLSPLVVLDEDGMVAQQYQAAAIPQTVIIDRDGKLTHLFVGGGQRFLTDFTAALRSVVNEP